MSDLSMRDRLQPSLLDRLTDDDPTSKTESRDQRFFTLGRLRAAVLRDLSWLLNTVQFSATEDLTPYPHVAASVLNYGAPVFSGKSADGVRSNDLQARMAAVLRQYEPRLLADTVTVQIGGGASASGSIDLRIEADLWAQPVPIRMMMKTEIDRELDTVRVVEQGGRRD
ncbi:MAG TPA: type VI secretion system baseplate subunit TssE [Aliidongia sp.]|nr:type VI secretion system baseplate subunit TssE [Aliidongia sp.]